MKPSRTRFTLVRTGALGAFALAAVLVACEARLPTSAEVEKMDVASAERAAVSAKLLEEKKQQDRIYTVDGVTVSDEVAHKLDANKIATVNILKNKLRDEIQIRTAEQFKKTLAETKRDDAPGMKDPLAMKVAYLTKRDGGDSLKANVFLKTQPSKTEFKGIVIVDGVTMPGRALAEVTRDDIVSIEVMKGAAATQLSSDPAAANGIIKVTTKRGKQ